MSLLGNRKTVHKSVKGQHNNNNKLLIIEPIESVHEHICAFLARLETVAAQDADCKSVVIPTHSGILGKFIRQVVSTKGGTLADELVNYVIGFIRCDNTSVTEIKLTMGKDNVPVYHIETIACARHLNC